MNVWETLSKINCNDKVEKKGKLSYLSWAWAWAEVMKRYPSASYDFTPPVFFQDGSCEVWVSVTIEEMTRTMWLPVMDHKNHSIINPSSRQISDSRMRCLTKCLAMFGLAHYIYAGEDIPEMDPLPSEKVAQLAEYCVSGGEWTKTGSAMLRAYNIQQLEQLPLAKFDEALARCKKASEAK